MYIYFGFAEKKDNEYFNSSMLLGPEGILEFIEKFILTKKIEHGQVKGMSGNLLILK